MFSKPPSLFWTTFIICVTAVYGRSVSQQSTIIHSSQSNVSSNLDLIKHDNITNEETDHSKPELRFPAKKEGYINGHQSNTTNTSMSADLNTTDITTVNSTTTLAGQFHSNFNLALIPVVVGVVFIIAVCLKCCQWFRQYTRGGSKDNQYYAEIVEDGDDAHLDIVSDTTSTAYYDTVSSYTSFLRKSNNDSTVTSAKSFKVFNDITDSPRKWLFAKIGHGRLGNQKLDFISCDAESDVPLTQLKRQRRITSGTSSSSGEETEVTEIEPLNSSDASILRKQNRFRVSFITNNDGSTSRELFESAPTLEERRPPVIKRLPPSPIPTSNLVMCSNKPRPKSNIAKPQMVSVGTQTNKTCRKSLRNSQIRHMSDNTVSRIHQLSQTKPLVPSEDVSTNLYRNNTPLVSTCKSQADFNKDNEHTHPAKEFNSSHIGCNLKLNEKVRDNTDVVYSETGKTKCSVNSISCNSESTEADFTDDVFMSDTEPDCVTNASDEACDANHHENTIQTLSREVGVDNVDTTSETLSTNPQYLRISPVESLHVTDKLRNEMTKCSVLKCEGSGCSMEHSLMDFKCCTSGCVGDIFPGKVAVSRYDPSLTYSKQTSPLCDNHFVMHMTSPSYMKTPIDGLSLYHSNSIDRINVNKNTCDLVSACTHCGWSMDDRASGYPPRRHSSINNDQRSVSLPSLESSGYAEELSFDGSD